MADEVLLKFKADYKEIVAANEAVFKELSAIEDTGTDAFKNISVAANNASGAIKDVTASFRDTSNSLKETDQNSKRAFDGIAAGATKASSSLRKTKQDAADVAKQLGQLNFAVAQITRELPAFTYNLQTGFMAIANNLPILADQINQIKAQNKLLAAEGKQTQNVLGAVAGAVLSWQTALSLGLFALTALIPKVIEFVTGQEKSTKAVKDNTKAIQENRVAQRELVGEYSKIPEAVQKEFDAIQKVNRARGEGVTGLDREIKLLKAKGNAEDEVFKKEQERYELQIIALKEQRANLAQFGFPDQVGEISAKISDIENESMANRIEYQKKKLKEGEDEYLHSLQRRKMLLEAAGKSTFEVEKQIFDRRIQLAKDDAIKEKDIIAEKQAFIIKSSRESNEFYAKEADKAEEERLKRIDESYKASLKNIEAEAQALKMLSDAYHREFMSRDKEAERQGKENFDRVRREYLAENEEKNRGFEERRDALNSALESEYITKEEYSKANKELDKAEAEARLAAIGAVGNALGELAVLAGENTELGKGLAAASAIIDTYKAASSAFAGFQESLPQPYGIIAGTAAVIGIVAAGLARVQKIYSVSVPKPNNRREIKTEVQTFATGVVDLQGPGTTTSDSIPAMLSKGESVIKASSTAPYKDELKALNTSPLDYDRLIYLKHVKPALDQERSKNAAFVDNLAKSIALQGVFNDRNIVKAIKANKPATKDDIAGLATAIEKQNRNQNFERKLYKVKSA